MFDSLKTMTKKTSRKKVEVDNDDVKVTDLSHSDGSDHEVGQLLFIFHSHSDTTINFLAIFAGWPILNAHDLNTVENKTYEPTFKNLPPDKAI